MSLSDVFYENKFYEDTTTGILFCADAHENALSPLGTEYYV